MNIEKTENGLISIDLDKVIKIKNQRLYRWLPRFVIKYLERLIYQDEINYVLREFHHLQGCEFIEAALNYMGIKYLIEGKENIPETGRYIFVANHPLGGIDGLAFIHFIGTTFGKVKAIINDLLMNVINLRPVFVGVNLYGANTKDALKTLDETFESDNQIMIFPAGFDSRKIEGKIQDIEWKKMFINRSIRHKLDIVPVFIEGKNTGFFYNFSRIRKKLGIKFNIELIFLPGQMFKQKGKTIKLIFGRPISYAVFNNSQTPEKWASSVRSHVYSLAVNHNNEFVK